MSEPLRIRVQPSQGQAYEQSFDRDSVVVGRASTADLSLPDRFLSRQHTRIFRADGHVYVEDLGSRNGTLLNGQPVTKSMLFTSGDEIRLSGNLITLAGHRSQPPRSDDMGLRTIFRDVSSLGPIEEPESAGETELRRYADRLRLLNDIHHALASSVTLDELLELILDRTFEHLRPEQGGIYLLQPDGSMKTAARRYLAGDEVEQVLSRSLVREVVGKRVGALVLDARTDERFASAESILTAGMRSLLAAPLLGPEGPLGLIVLGSRAHVRQFGESDLDLLGSLASVAALRIHNVALAEEAAERRLLEKELTLARRIQEGLIPSVLPELPGYELHAENIPSRGVSGDFYNVVVRSGDSCAIVLADVSGKGMAASLLTASLEALTAGPLELGDPPELICEQTSRRLHRRTPPEKYATAFLAELELGSGRLGYCNAGHNAAVLLQNDGTARHLESNGLPVGLMAQASYEGSEAHLGPGDLLVLYTDGITEAESSSDEEFGLERLEQVCREAQRGPLKGIAERLEQALLAFADGVPFADDRTLILLRRCGG